MANYGDTFGDYTIDPENATNYMSSSAYNNTPPFSTQPYYTQPTQLSQPSSSRKKKATTVLPSRKVWTEAEDVRLCQAWVNVSTDRIVGNDQTGSAFWVRVGQEYHTNLPAGWVDNRNSENIQHHFGDLAARVKQFQYLLKYEERRQRSGVNEADMAGYRHIDCAKVYGNEKEIGVALKDLMSSGIVRRSELWITSKLWTSDQAPEDVSKALSKSLEDLQLDYIDLYLMHWPFRTKAGSSGWDPQVMAPLCLPETWAAMEGLYASGQARAIGVSNFSTKKLQDMLVYAKVPPAVNQVECHPVWQQPGLHNLCKSTGVHLTAYSPLGSPGSWVKGEILKEPIIIEIAEKLNKSPAQVALRWGIQSGHSVLPKSVNESRIKENLNLFDWTIPPELFSKFSDIHQQRLLRGDFAVHDSCSPYKSLEELWDGEI